MYWSKEIIAQEYGRHRYLLDSNALGEETSIGEFEPDAWHDELEKFINQH